mgnify:CR=1 FL=1
MIATSTSKRHPCASTTAVGKTGFLGNRLLLAHGERIYDVGIVKRAFCVTFLRGSSLRGRKKTGGCCRRCGVFRGLLWLNKVSLSLLCARRELKHQQRKAQRQPPMRAACFRCRLCWLMARRVSSSTPTGVPTRSHNLTNRK